MVTKADCLHKFVPNINDYELRCIKCGLMVENEYQEFTTQDSTFRFVKKTPQQIQAEKDQFVDYHCSHWTQVLMQLTRLPFVTLTAEIQTKSADILRQLIGDQRKNEVKIVQIKYFLLRHICNLQGQHLSNTLLKSLIKMKTTENLRVKAEMAMYGAELGVHFARNKHHDTISKIAVFHKLEDNYMYFIYCELRKENNDKQTLEIIEEQFKPSTVFSKSMLKRQKMDCQTVSIAK